MPRGVQTRACCTIDSVDPLLAARLALAENPGNHPGVAMGFLNLPAAIHMIGKTWSPGRVIKVGFYDGSPTQRAKVKRWAAEWTRYANLSFAWDVPDPEIRITFNRGGSWSMIGTDCLAMSGPTMQFGWVTDGTDDATDRAVIVHEFGHALGLAHEQSHPDEDIHWDRPKAIAWYQRTQGWTLQMIQSNVFDVFDRSQVAGTSYDRTSIMQYPVPAELTTDGRGIGWNTDLSDLDKAHIAAMYPGSVAPPPTPPPTPPPVTPPPTPGHDDLVIGGKAKEGHILAPGTAAKFRLTVPAREAIKLEVVVERSGHRDPIVKCIPDGQPAMTLGIPGGRGAFMFDPAGYQIKVYHPVPGGVGRVWVRASIQN